MTSWWALAALAALLAVVLRRPYGFGPVLGAAIAVGVAMAGGLVVAGDFRYAGTVLWQPLVTILAIMVMTSAAHAAGILDRLAAVIEPRTRGPVRRAFRLTFVLSAATAALLSNDAAVLLLTPTVIVLLRLVYPRRHGKFTLAFAFAVFAAAGVAPFVISNPMNLVVAQHAGIGFNQYAASMLPVAVAVWVATYACLAWLFRRDLEDVNPALGEYTRSAPLSRHAQVVLGILVVVLATYPVVSYLGRPLWPVAVTAALCAGAVAIAGGTSPRALVLGVSWEVFPFLFGVFVLALGLERAGVVDTLARLYDGGSLAVIGATAAAGSALINNHPMAVLNALALEQSGGQHVHILAALVGGDLGPRLLPMGSLAGLLWIDALRREGVSVTLGEFFRVGVAITVVPVVAGLAVLWLVT